MKFFRIKIWLARRSKRLDKKCTAGFWEEIYQLVSHINKQLDLDTKDIKFISKL